MMTHDEFVGNGTQKVVPSSDEMVRSGRLGSTGENGGLQNYKNYFVEISL